MNVIIECCSASRRRRRRLREINVVEFQQRFGRGHDLDSKVELEERRAQPLEFH
jgi:hypothetical protein